MGIFGKKKPEEDESKDLIVSEPISLELVKTGLPEPFNEQLLEDLANRVGIRVNAERSEKHEYREEIIPPVITTGTDLDKVDELDNGKVTTKTDKWGFWIDYNGTRGKVFSNEVPQFQFGHLGAMLPAMRKNVYKYTYDFDEKTGELRRDENGNPIVLRKERVHLGIELSNLKARLNLAEEGYARREQKDVIIGGYGQVDPYTGDKVKELLDFAWGKGKRQ